MKFKPVIKWSGSKRSQSEEIVNNIPKKEYDRYIEPFCGGCSMLYQLLYSEIEINEYICTDKNEDLINLWKEIKNNPEHLIKEYTRMWLELNKNNNIDRKREYYKVVRRELNIYHRPSDFFFILRTCTNGLVRYNKSGEFNNSFHLSRKGINPETIKEVMMEWSKKLNEKDVQFYVKDYSEIKVNEDDLLYLDPPYFNTKGMYFGNFNSEEFYRWLREQKGTIVMSYDGKTDKKDNTVDLEMFDKHLYLLSGNSSYSRLFNNNSAGKVYESLYIKYKGDNTGIDRKEKKGYIKIKD